MAQNTRNTRAFIETEVYSGVIYRNLPDGMLPVQLYRMVNDFNNGETLNIKTLGTVAIQDGGELVAPDFTPIESGTLNFIIDNQLDDAWYITDELREDGTDIQALMAARASESVRAFQEVIESRFLARAAGAMPNADPYTINGAAHKIVFDTTSGASILDGFAQMRYAFDKAGVSEYGRIAVVDPIVELRINQMITLTSDITPYAARILENGFARNHRFVANIMGFDVITSNRLPRGAYDDGTTTETDGVANLFFGTANDNERAMLMAWRRYPRTAYKRNMYLNRDEWRTDCRFGFGIARLDSLGVMVTPATGFTPRT